MLFDQRSRPLAPESFFFEVQMLFDHQSKIMFVNHGPSQRPKLLSVVKISQFPTGRTTSLGKKHAGFQKL